MKTPKIFLLISIIGIFALLSLAQLSQKEKSGIITELKYSTNKITITLENYTENLIIFDNKILDLNKGEKINFIANPDTYNGQKQLIVNQIKKISSQIDG